MIPSNFELLSATPVGCRDVRTAENGNRFLATGTKRREPAKDPLISIPADLQMASTPIFTFRVMINGLADRMAVNGPTSSSATRRDVRHSLQPRPRSRPCRDRGRRGRHRSGFDKSARRCNARACVFHGRHAHRGSTLSLRVVVTAGLIAPPVVAVDVLRSLARSGTGPARQRRTGSSR